MGLHSLVFMSLYFKWNAENLKLLVRKRSFTWNSHSRSFEIIHFAISHRTTRGSISSYNIAGLICDVSEEVRTQMAKNCPRQLPQSHLKSPPRGTAASILIFPENSHWPTFLSLHVWVYLHSNLFSGLQKTRLFCIRVRFGRSRSFRVIQGRWFWYQSEARIRLPISPSLWLWSCA